MSRFNPLVLARDGADRAQVLGWLDAALAGIDPESLTHEAIAASSIESASVIAIGKASPAMTRGLATATDLIDGICISDHVDEIPQAVELIIGDHPVPGEASMAAARSALRFAEEAPAARPLIGLISGGGSSLCEVPRPGISLHYLETVSRELIRSRADIEEINLVRSHLSSVKCGGVARAAGRAIDTYVISDVAGADPGVIASGPTVPREPEPDKARRVLERLGIEVPPSVFSAMCLRYEPAPAPSVTLLADGHDAAQALARASGNEVTIRSEWLHGDLESGLDLFLERADAVVSVAVGEPVLEVGTMGRGGRNTHAALLAATHIEGTDDVFVAFATDGVDGPSQSAGAIVDGSTIARGGDPTRAIRQFDSAAYLARTGDLLICDPTGTNVSDIWILWRRSHGHNVE